MLTRRSLLRGGLMMTVWAAAPAWAATWLDLGVRPVSLDREVDRITVVPSKRFFTRMRLLVEGNDVFLQSMTVHFVRDGAVRYRFDTLVAEGRKSATIDLPGDGRRITHVDLAYRRKAGGGIAVVTLQGQPA